MATANGQGDSRDRRVAELLKELSEQTTTLVRKEIQLARAEVTEKGKRVGVGLGMFGGTGLFGLGAFGALTACLVLALDEAVAAVLALAGRKEVERAAPPVPEQAADSVRHDVEWARERVRSS